MFIAAISWVDGLPQEVAIPCYAAGEQGVAHDTRYSCEYGGLALCPARGGADGQHTPTAAFKQPAMALSICMGGGVLSPHGLNAQKRRGAFCPPVPLSVGGLMMI